jgi:hypothetical protein
MVDHVFCGLIIVYLFIVNGELVYECMNGLVRFDWVYMHE